MNSRKSVKEWKNQVKMTNMNLKKLRESSTSIERKKGKTLKSDAIPSAESIERAGLRNSARTHNMSDKNNVRNRDLKDIDLEDGYSKHEESDEEIKQHEQNIKQNFLTSSISAGNSQELLYSDKKPEEAKQTFNYKRNSMVSVDSSDEEVNEQPDVYHTENDSEVNDLQYYAEQIMKLFPYDKHIIK